MQINSLADLLKDVKAPEHKPSLPSPQSTPRPEKNKVVNRPQREPINKQSAMLMRPMRSWIVQPLPDPKLPTREHKEIEELRAQLKIERNDHAASRDEVGRLRQKLSESSLRIAKLQKENDRLSEILSDKQDIIRQLEDLRL